MEKEREDLITKEESLLHKTDLQEKHHRWFFDIIKECLDRGMRVAIVMDEEYGFGYTVGGFYVTEHVLLLPKDSGVFLAITGKNKIDIIDSWEKFVRLNHWWWEKTKIDLKDNSIPLTEELIDDMKKFELIEIKNVVTLYKSKINYNFDDNGKETT